MRHGGMQGINPTAPAVGLPPQHSTLADAFKLSGLQPPLSRSRRMARYNLTYLPADRVAIVDAVSGSF